MTECCDIIIEVIEGPIVEIDITITPTVIVEISGSQGLTGPPGPAGPSGASLWGSITGTLSSQTDLQSALNAKQNLLGYTPENVSNKSSDLTASTFKYPTVNAVLAGLASLAASCVPYTGANANVNLGAHSITANLFIGTFAGDGGGIYDLRSSNFSINSDIDFGMYGLTAASITSTGGINITPASGFANFTAKIPASSDFGQFEFQDENGTYRSYFGYIGTTAGFGARDGTTEFGSNGTDITFRPNETELMRLTVGGNIYVSSPTDDGSGFKLQAPTISASTGFWAGAIPSFSQINPPSTQIFANDGNNALVVASNQDGASGGVAIQPTATSNGAGYAQIQGTNSFLNAVDGLCFNPQGGNIIIGGFSEDGTGSLLQVAGSASLSGALQIQPNGSAGFGVYATFGDDSYFANVQTELFLVTSRDTAESQNLAHFDSENASSRSGFILSNSGNNQPWYQNHLGFFVNGTSFVNLYYPTAIGSITDAGKIVLNAQSNANLLTEMVLGSYNNIPISMYHGDSNGNYTIDMTWNIAGAGGWQSAQGKLAVNGSGNITKINNVFTSFPSSQGGANTFIKNDGAGNLSWASIVSGVSSVSNSDGTLTISPTTGAVVASLNLAHANTWTAEQKITLTTEQFRIGYDASNFTKFIVGSSSGLTITPGVDGTSAFNFTKSDGTTSILKIDSTNGRLGVGMTPSAPVSILGAGTSTNKTFEVFGGGGSPYNTFSVTDNGTIALGNVNANVASILPNVSVNGTSRTLRFLNSTVTTNEGFQFYNSALATNLLTIQQGGAIVAGASAAASTFQIFGASSSSTPIISVTPTGADNVANSAVVQFNSRALFGYDGGNTAALIQGGTSKAVIIQTNGANTRAVFNAGGGGTFSGGNYNFTGGNVGSNVASPLASFHAIAITEQSRSGYDANNFFSTVVGLTGSTTFSLTGSTTTPVFTFSNKVNLSNPVNLKNYTVATLPTGVRGDIAYVTDALAPSYLATIVGGGVIVTPVFYNGTNWVAT